MMRHYLSRLAPFLPLLASLAVAVAAAVGALAQGLPLPLDVVGVFLPIGAAATLLARQAPWRGALFVAVLGAVVVAVLYGG